MTREIKISLLGFTQSGKTCMVASFAGQNGYAGANAHSIDFLGKCGSIIEKMRKGDMSDPFPANEVGKPDILCFTDAYNATQFTFEEYAGEMLTKSNGAIDNLNIPQKDGVMLLLSAREPIDQAVEERIREIKDAFNDILVELARSGGCKPIIFVVTAADVLLDKNIDHSIFFELKKHIEERIEHNGLKITDTQFVSIIDDHVGKKVSDQSDNYLGAIKDAHKVITEFVGELDRNKKEQQRKKLLLWGKILLAAIVLCLVIVGIWYFCLKEKKCPDCGNVIDFPGATKCNACALEEIIESESGEIK